MTKIRQHHWLKCVKLEDLWVSLCPIERFDLYAAQLCQAYSKPVASWQLNSSNVTSNIAAIDKKKLAVVKKSLPNAVNDVGSLQKELPCFYKEGS